MEIQDLVNNLETLSLAELEELMSWIGGFSETPVSIDKFVDDPEFLGTYFQGELRPYWRQVLKEVYPSPYYSPAWLICFRGSIGQGKSTIACTCLAYEIYKLLCLIDPQKTLGLIPASKIVFAIFNRTLSLSTDVVWDKLSQIFTRSPYFAKMLGPLGVRRKERDTLFNKRIDIIMGSRIGHSLGSDVFSAIIDEANFDVIENQTYEAFNSLIARMESRFMKPGGSIPGKIFVVSSESDKTSALNKIVDQYKKSKGVYISQAALWEVVTHKGGIPIYSGNRFWVYAGSETRQPEIISLDNSLIKTEPENCVDVPVEHKDRFDADLHAALRDLAGRSTGTTYKLFRLKDKLFSTLIINPIFPDVIRLSFDDEEDQIINYCTHPNFFETPVDLPRYIHIDMGLSNDKLGISASYVKLFKERKVRDINTFQEVIEVVPEIVTEWATTIEATPGKQIPLYKIRLFLLQIARRGYLIGKISADLKLLSADLIQGLQKAGLDAEYLSVDKTVVPYFSMRSTVYEGRLYLPNSELLKKELIDLEVSPDGTKVDHPAKSSKDLADSCCGSAYLASQNADRNKLLFIPKKSNTSETIIDLFWGVQNQ